MTGGNEGEHGGDFTGPEFAGRVQAAAGHAGDYIAEPFAHHGDHAPAEAELNLTDHERLPWLGGDDEEEEPAIDHKRLGTFVAAALALLAALVGGIWWLSHPHGTMAEANGGTIAAPATPYKEAPKDPGGKTFDGTGDSSFAVSQGQTRPAQLAEGAGKTAAGAAVVAGAAGVAKAGEGAKAVEGAGAHAAHAAADAATAAGGGATGAKATGADGAAAEPAAPAGGVAQLGAYSSHATAEAGWNHLSQQPALSGAHHRIVQGKADIGTVYRLQVVTGAGGAAALCEKLRAGGLACQVKH